MRLAIGTALVAVMLAGPAQAAEGEAGGLAKTCRSVADGEARQFIDDVSEMTREELLPNLQPFLGPAFEAFLGLSEREQDPVLQQFRHALINLPVVTLSFCDYLARGAVPGIGADVGHGSLAVAWEFRIGIDGAAEDDTPTPGERECERPYSVTVELEEGTTKHIFCEAAAGFVLTSSHRAAGADRWTLIE